MAFQQSDLDTIDANISSGVLLTRFADGREVRYQSLDMLISARRVISAEIALAQQATAGVVRRKFASYNSGLG
ncbi:MAG: hypothetical protein M3Y41_01405 [Pseudomonadota bacterium]|nr:hypothetical protein [Pseudomonadota bacterium]